jgi:hypothetical protein
LGRREYKNAPCGYPVSALVRDQRNCFLLFDSVLPKPVFFFSFRRDLKVALLYAVFFCFLMVSCYVALYLKWFKLSSLFVFLGILLPVILKISRHRRLKRKRERRLLLPLSM